MLETHIDREVVLQGVQVLLDALETVSHANSSHELLGEFTTVVLNAIWDCVVANRRNLAHLLAGDGLGDLLDAIQACHAAVQPLALAVLAGTPSKSAPSGPQTFAHLHRLAPAHVA